jgi:hypothetical protein
MAHGTVHQARNIRLRLDDAQVGRDESMNLIVGKGMFVYISRKVIRNNGSRGRLLNRIVVAQNCYVDSRRRISE